MFQRILQIGFIQESQSSLDKGPVSMWLVIFYIGFNRNQLNAMLIMGRAGSFSRK